MAIVIQGVTADGEYVKIRVDANGNLSTSARLTDTSTLAYTSAPAALTWYAVAPETDALRTTIRNADASKYTLFAMEYIHKALDATTLAATVPATAGALLYALSIELQGDANTHIASTTYHKVAGQAIAPTHKVVDANGIAATNPATNDTTELYALADEVVEDFNVHVADATYHTGVHGTLTHTNATSEVTAVAEINALRGALLSHFANVSVHGGVYDSVNLALVTATSDCTTKTDGLVLINLLATYWLAHCALGGAAASEATAVAQLNAVRTGLLAHLANSTTYHQTADTVNLATVTATSACTNAATALTLANALYPPFVNHLAFNQREKYAAGSEIVYEGTDTFWVALESIGGFTVRTDR
jgi:hypothetical protein